MGDHAPPLQKRSSNPPPPGVHIFFRGECHIMRETAPCACLVDSFHAQYDHVTCHDHARLEELVKGALWTGFAHDGTFTPGGDMHPMGEILKTF